MDYRELNKLRRKLCVWYVENAWGSPPENVIGPFVHSQARLVADWKAAQGQDVQIYDWTCFAVEERQAMRAEGMAPCEREMEKWYRLPTSVTG